MFLEHLREERREAEGRGRKRKGRARERERDSAMEGKEALSLEVALHRDSTQWVWSSLPLSCFDPKPVL